MAAADSLQSEIEAFSEGFQHRRASLPILEFLGRI